MPRDSWGAEWGRYRRQKATIRKVREKQRLLKVDAVYLLRCADRRLVWFGEPQLVVKVGRSSRSPFQRMADLRSRIYELVAYWTVAREDLPRAELVALHAMKAAFGEPCDGREVFYVDKVEDAYSIVASSIASYVANEVRVERHDQLTPFPGAFRGSQRDAMHTLDLTRYSPVAAFPRWIENASGLGATQRPAAGDRIRPRRKARGRCQCEECRRVDIQKSLF